MARKRMIDPSFWDDLNVAKLTIPARLCFIGMISNADDEGRIEADPRYIKRAVFGFDDDLSSSDVGDMLAEIQASCPSVVFYQVDGRSIVSFTNWKRYQYIQKPQPSKLPPMPVSEEYDTSTVPVSPNRIEKNRKEGEGNDAVPPPAETPPVDRTVEARLFRIFENPKQVKKFVAAAVGTRGSFTIADVEVCEQWLSEQNFHGKIGTLHNILEAGQLPKTAAANEKSTLSDDERMRQYLTEFNRKPVSPADYRSR